LSGKFKNPTSKVGTFTGKSKPSDGIIGSESSFKFTIAFIIGTGTKYNIFLEQPNLATAIVRKTRKWLKVLLEINRWADRLSVTFLHG
jgi:hypothetical protein